MSDEVLLSFAPSEDSEDLEAPHDAQSVAQSAAHEESASLPESPKGGVCRICMDESKDEPLLRDVCGCKTATVHKSCLQQWVRRKASLKCEICTQTYKTELEPVFSGRATLRLPRRGAAYALAPMFAGFCYGYAYLSLSNNQTTGIEVAFLGNVTVVLCWSYFVMCPGCERAVVARTGSTKSAKTDLVTLCLSYACFLGAWFLQSLTTLPRVRSAHIHNVTLPAHVTNFAFFTVCAIARSVCVAPSLCLR